MARCDRDLDAIGLTCPDCGKPMHVRLSHMTVGGVFSLHYSVHNPDHGGDGNEAGSSGGHACGFRGGESNTQLRDEVPAGALADGELRRGRVASSGTHGFGRGNSRVVVAVWS